MMTNVFLYGSSGTGKTIVSAETVKIKLSQFKSINKPVKVIITQFTPRENDILMKNFKEKHFCEMDISICSLKMLSESLDIDFDYQHPKKMIEEVVNKLSERKEMTILLCDELFSCDTEGQKTPDWSDMRTADNVVWILALRPDSGSRETTNLIEPRDANVHVTKGGYHLCLEIKRDKCNTILTVF